MKEILVLGPGCYRCVKLYDEVMAAVKESNVECEVSKVTDIAAIAGFGVMQTPALVIDGQLKASGKLLTKDQIKKLIEG
jgi:small redox-active disulfide protein 2